MDYETVTFQRIDGGESVEWKTAESSPAILAYLDHSIAGYAAVTVFDPYTGRMRHYAARPPMRAMAIISRHLDKLGYKNRLAERVITPDQV